MLYTTIYDIIMHRGDIKSYNEVKNFKSSFNNISLNTGSIIPYVDDNNVTILRNYIFKYLDFTKNFTTSDNSDPNKVRIVTLPTQGIIQFDNNPVTINFEFDIININKLVYILTNKTSPIIESFKFQTSNNNINTYFSNMATFTFNIDAYVNLPPTAVGDNSITIDNASTYTFTAADFTTATTPAYSDPEGDSAANLKVLTLPDDGTLQFNNVDVTLNQIIPFEGATSITSGALKYIASQSNTNADVENFNFEISDSGSNTFVG